MDDFPAYWTDNGWENSDKPPHPYRNQIQFCRVYTAESHQPVKQIRPSKIKIRCMGGSQAAACCHNSRITAPAISLIHHTSHKRNHFICNIIKPLFISAYPPVRISALIRPGFLIQSINGKIITCQSQSRVPMFSSYESSQNHRTCRPDRE